jgi:uncharacterized membrane protein
MRIASVGHAVFAAILIGIGIIGLVQGGFAPIWDGVPKALPGREVLAWLCTLICLACGAGLFWRRSAAVSARVLLAWLVLWMLLVKGRPIVLQPTVEVVYESWGETAVLVAAAWVLYAGLASERDRRYLGFATGNGGVRIARIIFALALIGFGLSHIAYPNDTAGLVPAWIPGHVAWVYITGTAYLAAAAAILIGVWARLAATLATVQIAGFTLLVWGPSIIRGPNAGEWSEFVLSCALTAGAWVVADSYRGMPWLAVGKR